MALVKVPCPERRPSNHSPMYRSPELLKVGDGLLWLGIWALHQYESWENLYGSLWTPHHTWSPYPLLSNDTCTYTNVHDCSLKSRWGDPKIATQSDLPTNTEMQTVGYYGMISRPWYFLQRSGGVGGCLGSTMSSAWSFDYFEDPFILRRIHGAPLPLQHELQINMHMHWERDCSNHMNSDELRWTQYIAFRWETWRRWSISISFLRSPSDRCYIEASLRRASSPVPLGQWPTPPSWDKTFQLIQWCVYGDLHVSWSGHIRTKSISWSDLSHSSSLGPVKGCTPRCLQRKTTLILFSHRVILR